MKNTSFVAQKYEFLVFINGFMNVSKYISAQCIHVCKDFCAYFFLFSYNVSRNIVKKVNFDVHISIHVLTHYEMMVLSINKNYQKPANQTYRLSERKFKRVYPIRKAIH